VLRLKLRSSSNFGWQICNGCEDCPQRHASISTSVESKTFFWGWRPIIFSFEIAGVFRDPSQPALLGHALSLDLLPL
jgi:hypothetical protein